MNPQVKEKWIAALRSGEYKQGKSALRTSEGFCCLGVLCDLHAKEFSVGWQQEKYYFSACEYLPQKVADWAELTERCPETPEGALSARNDTGANFPAIARLIEEYL